MTRTHTLTIDDRSVDIELSEPNGLGQFMLARDINAAADDLTNPTLAEQMELAYVLIDYCTNLPRDLAEQLPAETVADIAGGIGEMLDPDEPESESETVRYVNENSEAYEFFEDGGSGTTVGEPKPDDVMGPGPDDAAEAPEDTTTVGPRGIVTGEFEWQMDGDHPGERLWTPWEELEKVSGVGEHKAKALYEAGFETVSDLIDGTQSDIAEVDGIGNALAARIKADVGGRDLTGGT